MNPATGFDDCHGEKITLKDIYNYFATHGVDLVLTGHDHLYSRWDSVDGDSGNASSGVPQIIVGTGGAHADPPCSATLVGNQACIGNMGRPSSP